jgi:surface antigen
MKQLDANTLVAYVDGELDIETATLVESLLVEDAEAREVTGMLRGSASLVRAAHSHVLHEAVPDRLLDVFEMADVIDEESGEIVPRHLVNMILGAPDDVSETAAPALVAPDRGTAEALMIPMARRRSIAAFATAAAFAAVMVGGGMMFQKYTSGLNQGTIAHQAMAVAAMDDPWREAAFQEALETKKSEAAVIWANPENGRNGAIVPVKTYRRDDGTFCRAFRTVDVGVAPGQPNYGVACREPGQEGRWIKTVEAIAAPGTGTKLQF